MWTTRTLAFLYEYLYKYQLRDPTLQIAQHASFIVVVHNRSKLSFSRWAFITSG
jgi:hypothetical protein